MAPAPYPADPKDALLVWAARFLRTRGLRGLLADEFQREVQKLIPDAGAVEALMPFGPTRAVERAYSEAQYREHA